MKAQADAAAAAELAARPRAEAAAAAAAAEADAGEGDGYPRLVRVMNNSVHSIKCRESGFFLAAGGFENRELISVEHAEQVFGALRKTVERLGIDRNSLAVTPA